MSAYSFNKVSRILKHFLCSLELMFPFVCLEYFLFFWLPCELFTLFENVKRVCWDSLKRTSEGNLCLQGAGDDNYKRFHLPCVLKVLFEQWQHSRSEGEKNEKEELNDFLIKCFHVLCQCLLSVKGFAIQKCSKC